MGLGSFENIGLAAARKLAEKFRLQLKEGINPIEARHAERNAQRDLAPRKVPTFADCAREYGRDHEPGWRNEKHRAQWGNSLKAYALPSLGRMQVSDVDGQPSTRR